MGVALESHSHGTRRETIEEIADAFARLGVGEKLKHAPLQWWVQWYGGASVSIRYIECAIVASLTHPSYHGPFRIPVNLLEVRT